MPLFLAPRQLSPFIAADLLNGPLKPFEYIHGDKVVSGFEAGVLVEVCKIWLKAREAGALQAQQLPKAQKAEILLGALAETGIIGLVDEATGYQEIRPRDALEAYLNKVLRRELAAWAKKFPDEFYENIYRLKKWSWPGMKKNRFSVVAHYTRDLVYERLGPGILKELEKRTPKNESGQRKTKMHQWLTEDIGDPMLAQHLHSLIMFQRLALANGHGWNKFVKTVDQVMPKRGDTFELPLHDPVHTLTDAEY